MFIHSPSLLLKLIDISSVGNTISPLKIIFNIFRSTFSVKNKVFLLKDLPHLWFFSMCSGHTHAQPSCGCLLQLRLFLPQLLALSVFVFVQKMHSGQVEMSRQNAAATSEEVAATSQNRRAKSQTSCQRNRESCRGWPKGQRDGPIFWLIKLSPECIRFDSIGFALALRLVLISGTLWPRNRKMPNLMGFRP